MAMGRAWLVAGLCAACSGNAAEHGGRAEADGETSFPIHTEMVSRRNTDNVGCFGPEDVVGRSLDEMAGNTCELARSLRLADIRFSEADSDGRIEPGEVLRLHVDLEAMVEHLAYPGVSAHVASPHIAPSTNVNGLYAILAVSPRQQLRLDFGVSPDAESGDTLAFAVCATDFPGRRVPCRQVDELDFELTVD
jgi:hypothetical protein